MPQFVHDILWIALLPLSWIYGNLARFFVRQKQSCRLSIPVVSIGNIHSGGTGKTPLVVQLTQEFEKLRPAVVTRGYRGEVSKKGAVCDPTQSDGPSRFGDEPWMISKNTSAKVYVGARRLKVVKDFSVEKKHGLIFLDDGFQHRQIFRNVDVVVIPGEINPWESSCLPLGDLREPLSSLKRASCLVITGSSKTEKSTLLWIDLLKRLAPQLPTFFASRSFELEAAHEGRLGAFCGIAHPERFRRDLEKSGQLDFFKSFSDHYCYQEKDLSNLIVRAREAGLRGLVTTEKDYHKINQWFEAAAFPLSVAKLKYQIPREFVEFIESRVA